ncbi:WecB/TagA/CpsF family glycosyltransferase [Desulfobacterales bacterium HSG17]|nr:WecB/TagA/CpsF family glycosyltransferase [Desulfobacterales bacterium HSG17]
MFDDTVAILGIPIDNVTMDEAIDRIFLMIRTYADDLRPRLVATVNVDFLTNSLSWFAGQPRHPELLRILRRADMVTADGMPLLWISRIIGKSLKERVTGADLAPRLAKEAARRGKSIYFLGGAGDAGEKAAQILHQKFPDLTIAGLDAPFVYVSGERLESAYEADTPIVEQINNSKADILLVAFGNPKQEVWFARNRERLQVPITIGIGGTFEFITQQVRRAPLWMQKAGLEWVFRISQDPKRLWKRYLLGFFKLFTMILPVAILYQLDRILFKIRRRQQTLPNTDNYVLTDDSTFQIIPFPEELDAAEVELLNAEFYRKATLCSHTILDFRRVTFIDSSGIGFLIKLWRQASEEGKQLYLAAIGSVVRRALEISRANDLFRDMECDDVDQAFEKIQTHNEIPPFFYYASPRAEYTLFRLFGALDAAAMTTLDMNAIFKGIRHRFCVIDLSNLNFVDSSGIIFFLKIRKHINADGGICVLFQMQETVNQMFRITRLNQLFTITDDLSEAEKIILA